MIRVAFFLLFVSCAVPSLAERRERCRVACKGRPWHYTPPTAERFGWCECEWPS